MNIYTKINQTDDFTEVEKNFLDYILNHTNEIMDMSITQIAKQSYVSLSTIYRVFDKLDISGINEFKRKISTELVAYQLENKQTDYNYPFKKNNTSRQIVNNLRSLYNQSIDSTINLLDMKSLNKIVDILYQANRICVYPTVGNYFMAESFQQNMLEIGKNIEIQTDYYYQNLTTSTLKKNDVVIIISYAGKMPNIKTFAKEVNNSPATSILISSYHEDTLSKLTDYHLYFSSHENSKDKLGSFSSRASLQFLLDTIYACYFNINYERNLQYRMNVYKG